MANVFLVTTVPTVTTVHTVITATTVTTATTATTVTTITLEYQMLLLYSSKGNFFTKVLGPTNRPLDQPTTRLLELLWAAKNRVSLTTIVEMHISTYIFEVIGCKHVAVTKSVLGSHRRRQPGGGQRPAQEKEKGIQEVQGIQEAQQEK